MAAVLVQSVKVVVTGVNNVALAYASNVTAGNLLCNTHAHWANSDLTITTPTDTRTHTYVGTSAEQKTAGTLVHLRSFYVPNCSGGADTVTFDIQGTNNCDLTVEIAEFSGVATVSPLDVTAVGNGTGTAVATAATATTAQANELIWGAQTYEGNDTTITETGGLAVVQEHEGGSTNCPIAAAYRTVSSVATYTATWTLGASRVWIAHVATFKEAGGGGGPVIPVFTRQYRQRSS